MKYSLKNVSMGSHIIIGTTGRLVDIMKRNSFYYKEVKTMVID
jgi:superfamily II DNA/RNA helicase